MVAPQSTPRRTPGSAHPGPGFTLISEPEQRKAGSYDLPHRGATEARRVMVMDADIW